MLRLCLKHITLSAAFVLACSNAFVIAQGNAGSPEQPRSERFEHAMNASGNTNLLTPERLLIDFINSERRFREALNQHTFRRFPGRKVRYRIKARFYEYKLFRSTVNIIELNESALN